MAFSVRSDFGFIGRLFGVPRSWLSKVGAFCSSFCATGRFMKLEIPDNPDPCNAPVKIGIDEDALTDAVKDEMSDDFVTLGTAQTITGQKTIGGEDLSFASPGKGIVLTDGAGLNVKIYGVGGTGGGYRIEIDGAHVINGTKSALTLGGGMGSSVTIGSASMSGSVSLAKANADSTSTTSLRVATMGWANDNFWRKVTNATGFLFSTNGTISHVAFGGSGSASTVARSDHNHSGVYQPAGTVPAHSHSAASLTLQTATSGLRFVVFNADATTSTVKTIHLEDLKYTESGHSGNCIIVVDTNGNVTHSTNIFYDALEWLKDQFDGTNKIVAKLTTKDSSNNTTEVKSGALELSAATPYIDFHFGQASADYTSRIIESQSGRLQLVSPGHPILSEHPADTSNDTTDTSKTDNATALQIATVGYVNGKAGAPTNPATVTSIAPTGDGEDTTTWTAGGQNGLSVKRLMRTRYVKPSSGNPVLTAYYRTETYDKFGRIYSVSAESSEPVDTTTLITWT